MDEAVPVKRHLPAAITETTEIRFPAPDFVFILLWIELWVTELAENNHLSELYVIVNVCTGCAATRADRRGS